MSIFGMSPTEFVALLGALATLITIIKKADKGDVSAESIELLIPPLNKRIKAQSKEIKKLNKRLELGIKKYLIMRNLIVKLIKRIILELENLEAELIEEIEEIEDDLT